MKDILKQNTFGMITSLVFLSICQGIEVDDMVFPRGWGKVRVWGRDRNLKSQAYRGEASFTSN